MRGLTGPSRRARASRRAFARATGAAIAVTAMISSSGATAASPTLKAARTSLSDLHVGDLPANGPAALYKDEPSLPVPKGWPGAESFPRTAGTGRLDQGGFFWTDWIYDDHGAVGVPNYPLAPSAGSVPIGNYGYAPPGAFQNGADIFRAAVQLGSDATYWRVDFNTMFSALIPIAEWTFDTDNNAATGVSKWDAAAGVNSAGMERSLTITGKHAIVRDMVSGKVLADLEPTIDLKANSFIVKVPRSILPVKDTWRVRLASGVADLASTGFAAELYGVHAGTAVYNVTFRAREQEPTQFSYWNEFNQALALTKQNVSDYSQTIRWSDLAGKRSTPEEQPQGFSTRWYASSVELGNGIETAPTTIRDGLANFLGRVQPYTVYVPKSYKRGTPTPVTFLLHSFTQNHNQYAATTPNLIKAACEDRGSICITTLGRGGDGEYENEAELDFWEVWHQVAKTYTLDPERTILAGYSMGGFGSTSIGTQHPDLFARVVTWAGTPGGGDEFANLRWVPYYQAGGVEDELVPVTDQAQTSALLSDLGYRHRWIAYPVMDHVVYELADSFADGVKYMGNASRVTTPGAVTYVWSGTPNRTLGLGTTGAYWLRDLKARDAKVQARVDAVSGGRPDRIVTPVETSGPDATLAPTPGLATELTWKEGERPRATPTLTLKVTNVASLRVLPDLAGFGKGSVIRLTITADKPVTVRVGSSSYSVGAGTRTVEVRV